MSALPRDSDLDLFSNGQRVINLKAKIANCAFDLRMTQQQLDSPQIARFAIDQSWLGAPKRMRAKQRGIKPDQ